MSTLDFVLHATLPNHFGSVMSDIITRRQLICAGSHLSAVGYGFEKFKNRNDPLAAENRRVEIIKSDFPGRNS
jgi:hypothetical protein